MSDQSDKHKEHLLELTPRQVSHIIVMLLMSGFFIFIAGYYWGKRVGIKPFIEQFESGTHHGVISDIFNSESVSQLKERKEKIDIKPVKETQILVNETNDEPKSYYAQLAGFGTKKAALECEQKLLSHGFAVKAIERKSVYKKTMRTWYQIITYPETDKQKLMNQIDLIKKCISIKEPIIETLTTKKGKELFKETEGQAI